MNHLLERFLYTFFIVLFIRIIIDIVKHYIKKNKI